MINSWVIFVCSTKVIKWPNETTNKPARERHSVYRKGHIIRFNHMKVIVSHLSHSKKILFECKIIIIEIVGECQRLNYIMPSLWFRFTYLHMSSHYIMHVNISRNIKYVCIINIWDFICFISTQQPQSFSPLLYGPAKFISLLLLYCLLYTWYIWSGHIIHQD